MKQNNKKLYESIMKDVSKIIKKHLNENEYDSVQIEKNLEDCALGVIDFLNQEGDINWDENAIIDYVNGDDDPDFQDLVNCMIDELEEYGDRNNILQYLELYNTDETWKESIEVAILRAMKQYVQDLI
jgi:virulence-associated protein VapD